MYNINIYGEKLRQQNMALKGQKTVVLSLLAAVGLLALCGLVETQAVIRIGHDRLPALEVRTQHKWMAFHPGDYGSCFHSNLEEKQEDPHQTNC